MKKLFSLFVVLIAICTSSWAGQPVLTLSGEVKKGGEGFITLSVACNGEEVRDLQVDIILPKGFAFSENEDGTTKKRYHHEIQSADYTAALNNDDIASYTASPRRRLLFNTITGALMKDGPILDIFIKEVSSTVEIGETVNALATGSCEGSGDPKITFSGQHSVTYHQEDTEFPILVIENRFILDENATAVNYDSYEGDVLVKRTIKAAQWNTICLPFAMNEEQMTKAFGTGVQLADFAGVTFTDKGQNSSLNLQFNSVQELAAHHPYLIQVPDDITEFRVDGVTIDYDAIKVIDENDGTVSYNDPMYSLDEEFSNVFYGTYKIKTVKSYKTKVGKIYAYTLYLYLSANKFYYLPCDVSTQFKGYRGYFELEDLYDYTQAISGSGANINFFVDDDAIDGIEGITVNKPVEGVYDLQGRKVNDENLKRGVYIINGKKVVVK